MLVGVVSFALLLFVLITAALASPERALLLQATETEPNNYFDTANYVSSPGSVTGVVSNTNEVGISPDTEDYFEIDTDVGRTYRATLTVLQNPGAMSLRIHVHEGDQSWRETSAASATGTSITWTAYQESHYIRVEALQVLTTTVLVAPYRLDIYRLASTPTPTNTPLPGADDYEPNNSRETAYYLPIATSATAVNANFYAAGDEDWYAFYVKSGRYYRASTDDLSGVDTYLEVYKSDGSRLGGDNDGGGGFASLYEWQASYDGYYFIRVTNLVSSDQDDTYDLNVAETAGSGTAQPTSAPAAVEGIDSCEDNSSFDNACTIAANGSRVFNLVSPFGVGPDNDFYRIWVKPGLLFECRTLDLSPGVDPNMIVYDRDRNALGGNDDVAPGDYNSAFSYLATYEGWLYLLVGTGDRTPSDVSNSNYTLRCDVRAPSLATATSVSGEASRPGPTATVIRTPTPNATATSALGLTVRTLTTPTSMAVETPAPRFIPISILVYYDANGDRQPGAGEGVSGVSSHAYEAATNQLLAQGFTDDLGSLQFTVAAQGSVRVDVPFFGFSQLVAADGASIYLRVPPHASFGGMQ